MIKIEKISFSLKDRLILDDISFVLNKKDKIGLVGPNGAGKSTLLKTISGLLEPTTGIVSNLNHQNITYFPQEMTDEERELDAGTYIAGFRHDSYTMSTSILNELGITEEILKKKIKKLSGGQRTRVCLAAIMLSEDEVILLDEPTNNMDLEGIEILENFVKNSTKAFIIVSHDRKFLNNVVTKIVAIEKDRTGADIYGISFDEFLKERTKEREIELQQYETSVNEKKRLQRVFSDKRAMALNAGKNRNQNDNEKLAFNARKNRAAKKLMKNAKAIETRVKKLEELEEPPKDFDLNYIFKNSTAHLSEVVAKLDNTLFSYSGAADTIGPFSLQINRNDRMVIVGPNGTGKTTLLKLLLRNIKPTSGHVEIGPSVKFGLIDQDQSFPQPDKSVFSNFNILIENRSTDTKEQGKLRGMLYSMGIKNLENTPSEISPGERSKILVTGLAMKGCNVILFDEPTNHLDLNAIEELERALAEYKGTFIVISHDRTFIENIKPNRVIDINEICFK